jgi:hypothetical protein
MRHGATYCAASALFERPYAELNRKHVPVLDAYSPAVMHQLRQAVTDGFT